MRTKRKLELFDFEISSRVEPQVLEFERIGQRPLDHCFLGGNWRETMGRAKVVTPGDVNDLRTQRQRVPVKQTDVSYAIQQIARFATLHLAMFDAVLIQHMV